MTSSNDPLDALSGALGGGGAGGFDLGGLLQQAAQVQSQLQDAQARLANSEIEGSVAGGAVTVTVTGTGELVRLAIRPGTVDGDDEESLGDLADLVVAAYRDAKTRADEAAAEALGPLTEGLGGGLPGGFPGLG